MLITGSRIGRNMMQLAVNDDNSSRAADRHRPLLRHGFVVAIGLLAIGLIPALSAPVAAQQSGGAAAEAGAAKQPAYVTSARCVDCHQKEASAWQGSHHRWALREASEETVLGDFNAKAFDHLGLTTRFSRQDGKYFAETDGADGAQQKFEIRYTIGIESLQQYLVAFADGRLQPLDIAWDVKQRRWFHLYPDEKFDPGDGLHWTGPYKNWNARCAVCHQTNFEKRYDQAGNRYDSRWSEISVGCESCHGPAEAHLRWAKKPSEFFPGAFAGVDEMGLQVSFKDGSQRQEINACGPCHSLRQAFSPDSTPPRDAYADHYALALLRPGAYHPDGQILGEDYVLGSFLQSKMYARGVRCSNCHEPHSGAVKAAGNALCTQCHSPAGNAKFPTLSRKLYDGPEHHFHQSGSAGARCVSCHMPARDYMIVDPRRDHSFRIPRPDLTVKLGVPNACAGCHADKSAEWAAAELKRRFPNGRRGTAHYGETLAAGRSDAPAAQEALQSLAQDAGQPDIARATAISEVQRLARADDLLQSPSDLIRSAAAQSLAGLPPNERAERLPPLLSDPVRSVRIAAAQSLITVPPTLLPAARQPFLAAALAEMRSSLQATTDFPETHMKLGQIAVAFRNLDAADAAFKRAVEMDGKLVDGWTLRAEIGIAQQRLDDARVILTNALAMNPKSATLHQSLAAVLRHLGKPSDALASLQQAHALAPNDVGILMEIGALHEALHRREGARKAYEQAIELAPKDSRVLIASAVFYLRSGERDSAKRAIESLAAADPAQPMLGNLQRALSELRQ